MLTWTNVTDGVSDLRLTGCFVLLSRHLLDFKVTEVCVCLDSQTLLIHQQILIIPVILRLLKWMLKMCSASEGLPHWTFTCRFPTFTFLFGLKRPPDINFSLRAFQANLCFRAVWYKARLFYIARRRNVRLFKTAFIILEGWRKTAAESRRTDISGVVDACHQSELGSAVKSGDLPSVLKCCQLYSPELCGPFGGKNQVNVRGETEICQPYCPQLET